MALPLPIPSAMGPSLLCGTSQPLLSPREEPVHFLAKIWVRHWQKESRVLVLRLWFLHYTDFLALFWLTFEASLGHLWLLHL